jgi:hypothetical protein
LAGDYYKITTAGTSQSRTWVVGDQAIYNGSSGSWTQVTGFFAAADAADLASKAALIEREGLRFDGTAGAVIGNGGIPAVGTGDWSFICQYTRTAAAYESVIGGAGSAVLAVRIYDTGVDVLLQNTLQISFTGTVPTSGVLVISKASSLTSVFVNGAQIDTAKADSNNYSTAETTLGQSFLGGTPAYINGAISHAAKWNYALTQPEITALIGRGLVTLPEQRGGSMQQNTSPCYTTFGASITGASATGFSLTTVGTGYHEIRSAPVFSAIKGQRVKISFTQVGPQSLTCFLYDGVQYYSSVEGDNSFIATVQSSTAVDQFVFAYSGASGVSFVISNLVVQPLGTLFEQDSGQRNAGYMVRDTSGNNCDLILPASGVSVIDPAMRGMIRFTTNTSGNQQIGGAQVIIPTNARISSWVINSSGTPNVTLGNVSAGAQYRASAAVVSGDNQIALLTPFTTGNLWVNSSTTATLKHTIMWEYIQ